MAIDYAALKAGGFMRQKQSDTFSLRLRVVGGTVTTEQLVAIKGVADRFGKGYIHLTSRQGIEIPFVKLEDIDAVKECPGGGRRLARRLRPPVRTVTACQAGRCCPSGCIEALDIAEKLDARYFGRQLPHKFKFGVTGCQNNCLKAEENDFGVKGGLVPTWDDEDCIFCGVCEKVCRSQAIKIEGSRSFWTRPNATTAAAASSPVPQTHGKGRPATWLPSAGPSATISGEAANCSPSSPTRTPSFGWQTRPLISSMRTEMPANDLPRPWSGSVGIN